IGRGCHVYEPAEIALRRTQTQRCMRGAHRERPSQTRRFGEILDLRAQTAKRRVLDNLLRAPQRNHMEADALPFNLEKLVENERLRQARKTVDDDGEINRARDRRPRPARLDTHRSAPAAITGTRVERRARSSSTRAALSAPFSPSASTARRATRSRDTVSAQA